MARRKYDDATRAAVIAALMTGQSLNAVAKEYKIPIGTVESWKRRKADLATKAATRNPQDVLGAALHGYVTESLTALRSQVKVFGDPDWIKKQSAHEMGVLHGIMTDKAMRLLEAMSDDD